MYVEGRVGRLGLCGKRVLGYWGDASWGARPWEKEATEVSYLGGGWVWRGWGLYLALAALGWGYHPCDVLTSSST